MRFLPGSRYCAILAIVLALAVSGVWYWRGEAHFAGRSTTWWAVQVRQGAPDHCVTFSLQPRTTWVDKFLALFSFTSNSDPPSTDLFVGNPHAVPVLIELLCDGDPNVRYWAAVALLRIDPPPKKAVPALLAAVRAHARDYPSERDIPLSLTESGAAAVAVYSALERIDPLAAKQVAVTNSGAQP
jgi:hypothetical protein